MVAQEVPDQSWTWQEAFTESVAMLNDCASSQDSASPRMRAREVAHVAFQGYKALVVSVPHFWSKFHSLHNSRLFFTARFFFLLRLQAVNVADLRNSTVSVGK